MPDAVADQTPLFGWHVAAGAKMGDFAGWQMPLEYPSGTVTEHRAVRSGCGIFDVSHMGCLSLRGPGALAAAQRLFTNDLTRLAPGGLQYTLLCDESGGVIDDMMVTLLAPDELLVVPNAANTAAVVAALVAAGVEVDDTGSRTAIVAVQGPGSPDVLARLGLPADHDYMTARVAEFEGTPLIVSRSGYTGERGYELLIAADAAVPLWEALAEVPQVTPAGLGARDTLRTEMGYPLHGQDLTARIGPVEARLGWAVAWDKPEFAGRTAVQQRRADPRTPRLWGLRMTDPGVPRPQMTVRRGADPVGTTTSGTFSPTLRQGIALALLDRSVAVGDQVVVDVRGRSLAAEVVRPPFVPSSPR